LVSIGPDRLHVMAVIRALRSDVTLSDAKALVEPLPQVIKNDVAHDDVESIRRRFLDVGAIVQFVNNQYGGIR
jgi:ribosomal protein L7/L12